MITAIVRFEIPKDKTLEDIKAVFEGTAPKYRGLPGLVRKYYLFDPQGTAGGVYLWESREAAERLYTEEWRGMIAERYGAPPDIRYFDTPVIVDNSDADGIAGAAE